MKYRLELAASVTGGGNALDGDWDNLFGDDGQGLPTYDDFSDDPAGRYFITGNGVAGGGFSFFFSVLPGDYNQDGRVTSADTVSGTVRDGDGDGVIENGPTADDTAIATAALGTMLPIALRGDYNDDEIIDVTDYIVWKFTFGDTQPRPNGDWADGSDNGIVDAADYTTWFDNRWKFSAWHPNGMLGVGSGSAAPVVLPGVAPRVMDVTISGSNSTHDPYSFDTENAVGSGEQLRTVPVGAADTISITFSEDVNLVASDLTVVGLTKFHRPTLAEFSYDIGTMTATWRFDDLVANDQYAIVLSDAVTDVEGFALDGEWTNPASVDTEHDDLHEFPSGDDTPGGDFSFVFTLLAGDANRDLMVDVADDNIWNMYWGEYGGFEEADYTGDGYIDNDDWIPWIFNSGLDLRNLVLLGDLNNDWIVDETDIDILYNNRNLTTPTVADGDLNEDGDVDIDDLDLMFAQYGLQLSVVS